MGKHSNQAGPAGAPGVAAGGECRHYFVKQNGTWTCTMCGATR